MVELVVLLNQLVAVVGHGSGLVFGASLAHHSGKVGYVLNDFLLLGRNLHVGRQCVGNVDAGIGSLAQDRAYTGIGVLYERTRVAVEVDTLLGVEQHVFAGVDLEQEVLEGAHAHDACHLVLFVLGHVGVLVSLVNGLACLGYHACHQVVGVNHRTLAALHFAVGQFHHAV